MRRLVGVAIAAVLCLSVSTAARPTDRRPGGTTCAEVIAQHQARAQAAAAGAFIVIGCRE